MVKKVYPRPLDGGAGINKSGKRSSNRGLYYRKKGIFRINFKMPVIKAT